MKFSGLILKVCQQWSIEGKQHVKSTESKKTAATYSPLLLLTSAEIHREKGHES